MKKQICFFCKKEATVTALTCLARIFPLCEDCWGIYGAGPATSFKFKNLKKIRKKFQASNLPNNNNN